MVSSSQIVSATLYSLWRGLHPLFQCGIFPIGDSHPRASPMCVLPKVCNSSLTVPTQVLFTSPSGRQSFRDRPFQSGSPTRSQICQQTCSRVAFSPQLHRLLPGSCSKMSVQWGHSCLWGHYLLYCGVLCGLQVDLWLPGHSCLTMGCRWIPDTASPSFCTNLGVSRVVSLMYSHYFFLCP